MKIVEKKVDELKAYENNPRKNEEAVKYVTASIKEFGFKVPVIVDKDNVIVAGHTRVKAAQELGMTTVPCIVADDLTEEQVKAFRLADNKVSEFSLWDFDLLNQELEGFEDFDMSAFGFINFDESEVDLEDFFEEKEEVEKEEKEEAIPVPEEIQCPHCKMFFTVEK